MTRRRMPRRHPAEVTSDRLYEAAVRWCDPRDGDLITAIERVRGWLDSIAARGGQNDR